MNTRIIVALLSLTLAMSMNDPAQGDEKNLETPNPIGTRTGEAPKEQKPSVSAGQGDGQHDFDFAIGTWKTHLWYRQRPLTGSNTWVEYEGTSVVRKVWNGRANLVELEVDGPAVWACVCTIPNPASGALIFPTAPRACWSLPRSASSRMDAASFSPRKHLIAEASLSEMSGRTSLPIQAALNRHSRTMEARLGK
jgi:hypothetical protein